MNNIKKTIFTLNIYNYAPEITKMTYPLMEKYATKIGADFHIITERKFPEWPVVYEKLQIYELAKEMGNDWNFYFDGDALIHPDLFDPTMYLSKSQIMHSASDLASNRWKYDEYFLRDGRNIGSCNWFTIASDWCLDLWRPLDDLTFEQALKNIQPIQVETNNSIPASHLIDDYTLSRNIAKYGLKFKSYLSLLEDLGQKDATYFWHQYTYTNDKKAIEMRKILDNWMSDDGEPKVDGNIHK